MTRLFAPLGTALKYLGILACLSGLAACLAGLVLSVVLDPSGLAPWISPTLTVLAVTGPYGFLALLAGAHIEECHRPARRPARG